MKKPTWKAARVLRVIYDNDGQCVSVLESFSVAKKTLRPGESIFTYRLWSVKAVKRNNRKPEIAS